MKMRKIHKIIGVRAMIPSVGRSNLRCMKYRATKLALVTARRTRRTPIESFERGRYTTPTSTTVKMDSHNQISM
jgi:hypothetical protein